MELRHPSKVVGPSLADLQNDNAALQSDCHRMRPILSAQLRKNACHVTLYCGLADVELIGDVLVGISCRYQAQYVHLAGTQFIVGCVIG